MIYSQVTLLWLVRFLVSNWLLSEGPKIAIKEASRFFLCNAFRRHFHSKLWLGFLLRCSGVLSIFFLRFTPVLQYMSQRNYIHVPWLIWQEGCWFLPFKENKFLIFFVIHSIDVPNALFVNSWNFLQELLHFSVQMESLNIIFFFGVSDK